MIVHLRGPGIPAVEYLGILVSNALPNSSQVTLATFQRRSEGEAFIERLLSAGVTAHLRDEFYWQRWWFMSRRHAAIHVDVPEECLDEARHLLKRWQEDGRGGVLPPVQPIVCPECGQSRVQYPNMTRHFLLPTVIAHVLVALRITEHECYCEDCHHTWIPNLPTAWARSQARRSKPSSRG